MRHCIVRMRHDGGERTKEVETSMNQRPVHIVEYKLCHDRN